MKNVMVMELKRWLLLISTLLLSLQVVYADGIGMVEVPEGTISTVDTGIEATIENWGYDRIFVAIPDGWTLDITRSSTRSFAVRETGLWRIYGMAENSKSMLGRGDVYTGGGFAGQNPIKNAYTISGRTGWWLKPNEGMYLDIYVRDISTSGGTIDPLKIEKENPSIRVAKWYESFTLELSEAGWITAPWVVENAALVESPAVYSLSGEVGSAVYYEKYKKGVDVVDAPDWDEWLELKNSLAYTLTKTSLAAIDLEFPELDDAEEVETTVTPVWRVDSTADITYAYEWKSYRKVEGISLSTELDIPEWFELF